jgi:hypothetical protein
MKYEGTYRLVGAKTLSDFTRLDPEFVAAYDKVAGNTVLPPLESVAVAIADSGIYTDLRSGSEFFKDRVIAGRSFLSGQPPVGVDTGLLPETMGQHGSCVASIAAFGTTRVKLVDVQVEATQEGGSAFNVPQFVNAVQWAIGQGARIVNCSKQVDWENANIQSLVASNTRVLFISTGGNNAKEIKAGDIARAGGSYSHNNNILVGGCTNDGRVPPERGYGPAVKVMAPSLQIPAIGPYVVRKRLYKVKVAKYESDKAEHERRALSDFNVTKANLEQNVRDAAEGMAKALAERRLKALKSPQPYDRTAPLKPEKGELVTDDGTSFACPMIANIVAKMLLINPRLTPPELIAILVETAESCPGLGGKCEAGGMADPVAAYNKAVESRKKYVPAFGSAKVPEGNRGHSK